MKIVALDLHTLFPEADDENCLQVNEQEIKKLCGPDDELICCRNLDLNHCGTEENISKKVAVAIADADIVITNKVKLNKSNPKLSASEYRTVWPMVSTRLYSTPSV